LLQLAHCDKWRIELELSTDRKGGIRKSQVDVTPSAAPAMKSPGSGTTPDEVGLNRSLAGGVPAPLLGRCYIDRRIHRRSGLQI
jgi:hypothetical protein